MRVRFDANQEHQLDAIIALVEPVVMRLVAELHPERVVLFGSHARGDIHEASDIDLLLVVPDLPAHVNAWRLAREIAPELPLQLVLVSSEEWEETRDVVGGIAYPAHHEGRVLYAA